MTVLPMNQVIEVVVSMFHFEATQSTSEPKTIAISATLPQFRQSSLYPEPFQPGASFLSPPFGDPVRQSQVQTYVIIAFFRFQTS